MPPCKVCSFEFPRLDGEACSRCLARKPGLSGPELRAINDKPQCAGCGVLSSGISSTICGGCIAFYRTSEVKAQRICGELSPHLTGTQGNIPLAIACTPGVGTLLALQDDIALESTIHVSDSTTTPGLAAAILSRAETHRSQASDVRLHVGPPRTVQTTSSSNPFNNLSKARQLVAERQQKKVEARLQEENKGITVIAVLWIYDEKQKLVEVRPGVHVRRTFEKAESTKSCLDDLLVRAKGDYHKSHPEADELTWENVDLLADGSGANNDYSSLSHFDRNRPISDMFNEFRTQKLTTEANLKSFSIKIRFAILNTDLEADSYASAYQSAVTKISKTLKRPRADTTSSVPQSATKKPSARPLTPHHAAAGHLQPVVLKSAFKPRNSAMPPPPLPASRWSRNPPMQQYTFTRTTVTILDNGEAILTHSEDPEVIELSTDWLDGEAASKENKSFDHTGYIGCGFTKRAIYARKEYVFTQNFDNQTSEDEVKRCLAGEYELLALCHWFKEKFDAHAAMQNSKTIPKFYFNYNGSLLGTLQSLASGSRHVPFFNFIATPLLPCGPVDPRVRKFTGNDNFGDANDDLTKAIHAFVHFAFIYSQNTFLFCDLQGTLDAQRVMCLFDPQAHT
ncbi:hypothetical protein H0H93_006155 [Arthromyces matolae]|nr:hypothetical protein H0H93_006155 [Arthromyces matolae]